MGSVWSRGGARGWEERPQERGASLGTEQEVTQGRSEAGDPDCGRRRRWPHKCRKRDAGFRKAPGLVGEDSHGE